MNISFIIKMKKKEYGPNPIGIIKNTFYATKYKKGKVSLLAFDLKSLLLKSEIELDLSYGKFDRKVVSKFIFGDNVVLIAYYIDKKMGKKHYLLYKVEK